MADQFIAGLMAHLVADWLLQNDWMAVNKVRPFKSPAAWVHAAQHFVFLWLVFPFVVALVLAAVHLVVDTRTPLVWWRGAMGQARPGNPVRDHVAIWQDQVVHILCIYAAVVIT